MFGEHDDYEKAKSIADHKQVALGRKCIVVPGIEDPKKWTIGVAVNAMPPQEFIDNLRKQKE